MPSSLRQKRRSRVTVPLRAVAAGLVLAAIVTPLALPVTAYADASSATVQVLTINDFHGRLEADPARGVAGAAALAGAVAALRADDPSTIFASAGDNIGGSTFTSFIAQDTPTIDALAAAGLEVSTVGNHEFDRGFADLRDRVLPRYASATGSDGLAYGLGANVVDEVTGVPVLSEYAIVERNGIRIGFIGTVTEQTATAVNPALIDGIAFTSQLAAASRVAAAIDDQVDATVLLTHDGSLSTECASIADENTTFGALIRGASPLIDAIASGHTHQQYSCSISGRPVVQTGLYGGALGKLVLEFETAGSEPSLTGVSAALLPLTDTQTGAQLYPEDADVAAIVSNAVTAADALGRAPVGRISADILRGGTPPGSDRSVESALGNLLADITQQSIPGADIGVMNAGGLRADLRYRSEVPDGSGGVASAGTVTYRDVANVQPFANTIMTVQLTGAQLRTLLEQQWSLNGEVEVRRYLSVSEGFSYSYRPDAPLGARIATMALNGTPIDPAATYTVATISFLANGGDGLSVFLEGANVTDTGRNDLHMTVDHFATHPVVDPPALGRAVATEPEPSPSPSPDPPAGSGTQQLPTKLAATGANWSAEIWVGVSAVLGLVGLTLVNSAGMTHRRLTLK